MLQIATYNCWTIYVMLSYRSYYVALQHGLCEDIDDFVFCCIYIYTHTNMHVYTMVVGQSSFQKQAARATFKRVGSSVCPRHLSALGRTEANTMMSRSRPWNASTVSISNGCSYDPSTSLLFSKSLIIATCAVYRLMMPMFLLV
jgi:hypothetical protein